MKDLQKHITKTFLETRLTRLWQFQRGKSRKHAEHYSPIWFSEMAGVTILGISPGTRYMGIAMLKDGTLHDWKVKNFKGEWSDEKLDKLVNYIENLIVTHVVHHIACKTPHTSRMSGALNALIEKIKKVAKEYKIKLHLYTIGEIKEWFTSNIRNKKHLSAHMAERYPELSRLHKRENLNRNPYYLRLFEAVAATTRCHEKSRM